MKFCHNCNAYPILGSFTYQEAQRSQQSSSFKDPGDTVGDNLIYMLFGENGTLGDADWEVTDLGNLDFKCNFCCSYLTLFSKEYTISRTAKLTC